MNPLTALSECGQAVWLDYIRRNLMTSGELDRLVEADGLRGVTSNPTIFEKTITGSSDYDTALRALLDENRHTEAGELYEALAIEDIRMAADALRQVYNRSDGGDGFVSLEVSPVLAHDTGGTAEEGRRLWAAVDRPNLMIKVPATPQGIPAVESLIADGINVNVTLMFSLADYDAVAQAYIRGLKDHSDPDSVASVASFFVSRVDTAVDRKLEKVGTPEARALLGKIAIANAKRVYQRFRQIFEGQPFADQRTRGAQPQRVLWASTGTKNPAYSDVLYVEQLIGPSTVNTMPPATLNAFRDHGRARPRLEEGLEEAQEHVTRLGELGVDLDEITEQLQEQGVSAFIDSFTTLMAALDQKRDALLSAQVTRQQSRLGLHQQKVDERLDAWRTTHLCRRFWQKDPTIWARDPVPELADRLGWLDLHEAMHDQLDDLHSFAMEIRNERFSHAVLLGMGGSSLAPEVYYETFGSADGHPALLVLDSTHPGAVRDAQSRIDPGQTIFLVSSKSGTTLETLSLFRTFWDRVSRNGPEAGRHFVAITDPGTPLEDLARERGFRHVFSAPPTVGGRYSALSVFGLVPAAIIGIDVHRLLDRAWTMAEASSFCVGEAANPSLQLGATLGELGLAGLDKVTFVTSPGLAAFPSWLEQLIAESTGKDGKGVVPVASESPGSPESYGNDRLFVFLALEGDDAERLEQRARALEAAGHPVVYIRLTEKADLGQEMFRWEMAVAAAGAVLGIHPFNQPDVQLAKDLARQAMSSAGEAQAASDNGATSASDPQALARELDRWGRVQPGDYAAIQAYLAPTPDTTAALQEIRLALRYRFGVATTLGYGPRFLHSTGQLHKGGANNGLFLQLIDEPLDDVPVPETDYTFGALISAQALGDYRALVQRQRRVLRVNLGHDVRGGLARLQEALR